MYNDIRTTEEKMFQNILIVDDHKENIIALEGILEEEGRNFLEAESGEEALKILLKEDVSLILLDVQMPGMDGFETAMFIRSRPKTRHIPIIFVTAISKEQKHIFKGYESGAVEYLFKPVEPEIVRSKVKIFLEIDAQKKLVEQQNLKLMQAKQNTDNILKNVEEGFFLLGKDYDIKPQYSHAFEKMMGGRNLAGADFKTIMKDSLKKELYDVSVDFLDLMFRSDLEELDFNELNPLTDAPFEFKDNNETTSRYLSFNFKRIYNKDNKINELIVTAMDNTDQVILEKELETTSVKSKRQVELLHILKIEPQLLRSFLKQTEEELKLIASGLKKLTRKNWSDEKVNLIYRAIHSVKGNAALLDFRYISERAHQFEEIIKELKPYYKDMKKQVEELASINEDLSATVKEVNSLINQILSFYEHYNNGNIAAGNLIIKAVNDMVERLKDELGRKVRVNSGKFDDKLITNKDFLLVKDIVIQLTRNALYHSFDDDKTKEEKNTISLSAELNGDYKVITFHDNGNGLNYDAIVKKAIDSKKWKKSDLENLDSKNIAELIFEPGISTSNSETKIAGRGMGMSIVRNKLEEIKGKIEVTSESGKYCQFKIYLPQSN